MLAQRGACAQLRLWCSLSYEVDALRSLILGVPGSLPLDIGRAAGPPGPLITYP